MRFRPADTPEPFVDADDIADVAVAALTDDRHIGELYELTGPRLLTFAEAVLEISRAVGREIRYVPISIEDFAAAAAEQGVPSEVVEMLTFIFGEVLDGRNARLADGVQRALGREPRDFSDYARDAAATGIWNPSGHPGRLTSSGSRHPRQPHEPQGGQHGQQRHNPQPATADRERTDEDYAQQRSTGADRNADIVLGAAVIAMGLLAGLIYDWAITVMPALTAADDRTLVDAMQQTIDNPAFPLTFLAAGALAAVALVQARRSGSPKTARWIVAGLALYTVAVVVTGAIHIPLNEDLKNAGDPARIENLAAVRDDFATPWVAWNIVRTLAATAAFGALAWALVLRGRMERAEQPQRTDGG